ncbi:MAG: 4-hydroxythreonine-4-phosphate dehydrogenase PdxA [Gemmatimonadetes bacterium]|nr:4-hydroxythreonine-4-phosphate dehydrogenase PdxA [Gemmatimonadota bacterium]
MPKTSQRPRIAITLGDPRGIGPEIVQAALADPELAAAAEYVLIGPSPESLHPELQIPPGVECAETGTWRQGGEREAGQHSGRAVEAGISMALAGKVDGLVTAPISKTALRAAGYAFPGHTELLRDRCGVPDVTMIMAAEDTVLGGPLRVALLTVHVPLRAVPGLLDIELVVRRSAIASRALKDWWGIDRPRLAFAGVNPHASEQGLFGDEEERILAPAAERLVAAGDCEIAGIFPADTVFRRCLEGTVDVVVVPYHDVGLAVLKTLASETGVNVTAGLPFPRTSPDHGTAFDIAGRGRASPSSMKAAVAQCIRFCRRGR